MMCVTRKQTLKGIWHFLKLGTVGKLRTSRTITDRHSCLPEVKLKKCHIPFKVFVVVIPKEGWAHVAAPILLLVWHRLLEDMISNSKKCVHIALGVPRLKDGELGYGINSNKKPWGDTTIVMGPYGRKDGQTEGNSSTPLPQLRWDGGQKVGVIPKDHAHPSFFWYDNDKDLKVCFLVMHLINLRHIHFLVGLAQPTMSQETPVNPSSTLKTDYSKST